MKKIIIAVLFIGTISLILGSLSYGRTKSYYSGDTLVYANQLYISTTNTDSLELFRLEGSQLLRVAKIKPFNQQFGRYGSFYDSLLRIENGKLFVYAVTDFALYKYELSNGQLNLINSMRNSFWEWYSRVDEINGQLVTISNKGLKIWNNDLQNIDAYDFEVGKVPYNVRGNERILLNINNGILSLYDREARMTFRDIPLNFKVEPSAHKAYIDENSNIYVVDDYYAKKYNLSGKLLASFRHLDYEAYDMSASGYNNNVYFSNGIGVVSLDKRDMSVKDWAWTGGIAGPRGWAMGMEVVYLNGDKVVVFNNSNILVLDENLDKIAAYLAEEEDNSVYATENLFLNLDKNRASTNSQIILNGGGYFPGELLNINFAGQQTNGTADQRGRFQIQLTVPEKNSGKYDIKVDGANSKLTYSIAFEIE